MSRPRPVLTSTGIAGLITSIAGVLSWLGYTNAATNLSNEAQGVSASAIGLVVFGSHILAGLHGQNKATPVADPQDHAGNKLAPVAAAPLTPGNTVVNIAAPVVSAADITDAPTASYADVDAGTHSTS